MITLQELADKYLYLKRERGKEVNELQKFLQTHRYLFSTNRTTDAHEFTYTERIVEGISVDIYWSPRSGVINIVTGTLYSEFGHYIVERDSPPDPEKIKKAIQHKINSMSDNYKFDIKKIRDSISILKKAGL
jgi:hypothetical protein